MYLLAGGSCLFAKINIAYSALTCLKPTCVYLVYIFPLKLLVAFCTALVDAADLTLIVDATADSCASWPTAVQNTLPLTLLVAFLYALPWSTPLTWVATLLTIGVFLCLQLYQTDFHWRYLWFSPLPWSTLLAWILLPTCLS